MDSSLQQIVRDISWEELQEYCMRLADQVRDLPIKRIYGIARGGMLLAVMLSHVLKIKEVHSITLQSYDGHTKGTLKRFSDLPRELKNALIIDDVVATGETLGFIYKNIELKNCHFAVLFKQFDHPLPCDVIYLEQTNDWIKFPFETE